MDPSASRTKIYPAVLAVIVLGAAMLWFTKGSRSEPVAPAGESISPTGTPPQTAPNGAPPSAGSGAAVPSPLPARLQSFSIVVPVEGDAWTIGAPHEIVWNREGGVPGGLELVEAKGGKSVGWILPSVGPKQVSYTWDTRDVSVTRTGGTRKSLEPGSYLIKLAFDGKVSGAVNTPISIIASGGEVLTYVVRLQNVSVTPKVLTVPRGARILFINNDQKLQKISGQGVPEITVSPQGGISLLDTAMLAPGTYNYFSSLYTYQAPGTLIVK